MNSHALANSSPDLPAVKIPPWSPSLLGKCHAKICQVSKAMQPVGLPKSLQLDIGKFLASEVVPVVHFQWVSTFFHSIAREELHGVDSKMVLFPKNCMPSKVYKRNPCFTSEGGGYIFPQTVTECGHRWMTRFFVFFWQCFPHSQPVLPPRSLSTSHCIDTVWS